MTRLTEALNRANNTSSQAVLSLDENVAAWQFPAGEATEAEPELTAETPVTPASPGPAPSTNPVVLEPRLNARERSRVVVGDAPDPALVEQYRHLAAVLHHAQSESRCRSVMVTSALPSEGKTLTATNLALTLSESYQRRVLLIDADLRRPRVNEMFGLPVTEGLTESLSNPRSGPLPVHQITPTLWVLTAGRATADPMSTLVSAAMKQLLDEARAAFDWVVVDTPPIAILPDANLLASMIDTALLVVSANTTPYPMVQRAVEAIGTARILGVVLNRAEASGMPQGYGYYQRPQMRASQPRWRRWLGRSRGVPNVQ